MRASLGSLLWCLVACGLCLASCPAARGQTPVTESGGPGLETATVRWVCSSHCRPIPPVDDPGRFICSACSADALLIYAFGLDTSAQIKGGPSWMVFDLYRVEIKATSPAAHDQMMRLLQEVMVKAFAIQYRIEAQSSPVYRLTVGHSGPKFRPTDKFSYAVEGPAGSYSFGSVGQLVHWLNLWYYHGAGPMDHPAEDGTGLTGNYDIHLNLGQGSADIVPTQGELFYVLKSQLGLEMVQALGHTTYLELNGIQPFRGLKTIP